MASRTDPPIAPSFGLFVAVAQLADAFPSAWQLLPEQLAEPLTLTSSRALRASMQL
jgi:hypothetical protein